MSKLHTAVSQDGVVHVVPSSMEGKEDPALKEFLEKRESDAREKALAFRLPRSAFAVAKSNKPHKDMQDKEKEKRGKRAGRARGHNLHTLDSIIPDSIEVELPWSFENAMTNTGFAYASVRFRSNGCWDPEPSAGGASCVGLAQWSGFYNYYRPTSFSYDLEVSNREAFPMSLYVYNSNVDPGGVVGTAGREYADNQFGKKDMLGPLTGGQSVRRLRGHVDFQRLLGGKDLTLDDNFRGLTSSSDPADSFWFGFNTASVVVQTTAGVYYRLTLRIRVTLYDRVQIL